MSRNINNHYYKNDDYLGKIGIVKYVIRDGHLGIARIINLSLAIVIRHGHLGKIVIVKFVTREGHQGN